MNAQQSSPTAGNVILVAAPSGAGKSSLVSALLAADPSIRLSISCTTRAPRPGEQHGREYYFVTPEEFHRMQESDELLEWAKVHGNYYGTPKRWIEQAVARGEDVILEIDWQGARQVREKVPDCVTIFILPPSRQELERRLRTRAQDNEETILRRLADSRGEIEHAHEFDYIVINQDFEQAVEDICAIVRSQRLRCPAQAQRHEELIQALLR